MWFYQNKLPPGVHLWQKEMISPKRLFRIKILWIVKKNECTHILCQCHGFLLVSISRSMKSDVTASCWTGLYNNKGSAPCCFAPLPHLPKHDYKCRSCHIPYGERFICFTSSVQTHLGKRYYTLEAEKQNVGSKPTINLGLCFVSNFYIKLYFKYRKKAGNIRAADKMITSYCLS